MTNNDIALDPVFVARIHSGGRVIADNQRFEWHSGTNNMFLTGKKTLSLNIPEVSYRGPVNSYQENLKQYIDY